MSEINFTADSDSESGPAKTQKPCNHCNRLNNLVKDKPYCQLCDEKCYRECKTCHRPHDSKDLYTLDPKFQKCNVCWNKYLNRKRKLQEKRKAKEEHCSSPSPVKVCKTSEKKNSKLVNSSPSQAKVNRASAIAQKSSHKLLIENIPDELVGANIMYLPVLIKPN